MLRRHQRGEGKSSGSFGTCLKESGADWRSALQLWEWNNSPLVVVLFFYVAYLFAFLFVFCVVFFFLIVFIFISHSPTMIDKIGQYQSDDHQNQNLWWPWKTDCSLGSLQWLASLSHECNLRYEIEEYLNCRKQLWVSSLHDVRLEHVISVYI